MKDIVERRAVKIAAKVMSAAGLCRYDDALECYRPGTDMYTCDRCIEQWLMAKARKERKEG